MSENYKLILSKFKEKDEELNSELNSLNGKISLLDKQIKETNKNLEKYKEQKFLFHKSVEVVTLVQEVTKKKIKDVFEEIVTYALRYIYNDDYKFELEFGRRGNLGELNFKVKTDTCQELHTLEDTSAGGVLNILSFALRIVLLEISQPKIPGFLVLDEIFTNLRGEKYRNNASQFLKEISKRINRQIIMITQVQEFVENADNFIEIK